MLPPLTPGQELFLHSSPAFTPPPPTTPVLSVAFLAGITTCIYSHYIMSQGEMPYRTSQKTQTELNLLQRHRQKKEQGQACPGQTAQ